MVVVTAGVAAGTTVAVSATTAAATATGAAIGTATGLSLNAVNLILTVASLAYNIASRPDGKDRSHRGAAGFLLTENPTDPQSPQPIVYGAPIWTPPRLFRYVLPTNLNVVNPGWSPYTDKRVTCLHLGFAGPFGYDGGDLKVWRDDQPLFDSAEDVKTDSETIDKTLTKVGTDGRVWRFPKAHVIHPSVTLYVDGVVAGVGGINAGYITDDNEVAYTAQTVAPRKFVNADDSEIPTGGPGTIPYRWGFYPPSSGRITPGSMRVTIHKKTGRFKVDGITIDSRYEWSLTRNMATPSPVQGTPVSVPWLDVKFGITDAGRSYAWIDFVNNVSGALVQRFVTSYQAQPKAIAIETDEDGNTDVFFPDSQTGSTITATYRVVSEPGTRMTFRPGTADQDPLPVDAIRNTFIVGDELEKVTARTYSTENEVHEIIIGIHSGAVGFYDLAVDGKNAGAKRWTNRRLQVKLRVQGAGTGSHASDPAKGWVTLRHPSGVDWSGGAQTWFIEGSVTGTAKWHFSIADAYWATNKTASAVVGGKPVPTQGGSLPFAKYDVRVTALDDWGQDPALKYTQLPNIESRIFLATATEVVRHQLRLPYVSTLTIEEDDPSEFQQEGTYRVQFKGRKVWIPESTAAASTLNASRPEPGAPKWSRNPVHCAADLIRLEHHGAGKFFTWPHIDLTTWLDSAAWHDGTVTLKSGDTETRAELDTVIQSRSALHDHLAQMLAGSQVYPLQSGGTWKFPKDVEAASVMALTDDDLHGGECSMSFSSREERPDQLEVAFNDEDLDYELGSLLVRPPAPEVEARVSRRVDYTGVRRRTQVERVASREILAMRRNVRSFNLVGAPRRLLALEAGDFVTLTSTRLQVTALLCRVVQVRWGSNLLPGIKLVEYDSTIDNKSEQGSATLTQSPSKSAPAFVAATKAAVKVPAPEKVTVTFNSDGTYTVDVGSLAGAA